MSQKLSESPTSPSPLPTTVPRMPPAETLPAPMVLRGVRYGDYVRFRNEPANGHLRMVYHDGTLEIMSPEYIHEIPSRWLGLLIFILSEELGFECVGAQSTTFRRGSNKLKKGHGKEPDQCFFFANSARVIGKKKLDVDPPPDLWIEVDNRASSAGKLPVYAALGVPEVWRYKARSGTAWFGRLIEGGTYEPIQHSVSLPMLTPALVTEALALAEGLSEPSWSRRLRPWIRATLGPASGPGNG